MRPLLHLISIVLVLPGVAFASAFVILGHAIATRSLLGFLGELLAVTLWLVPWGLFAGFAALLALVLGGLSVRYRWLAALCIAILAIGSTISVFVLTAHSGFSAAQLWFFAPGLISASVGLWLTASEFPRSKSLPVAAR
jgi:hypothetical protein